MWGQNIDEDGCGGEDRETEAEVDGQCKCGLEVRDCQGRRRETGCLEATGKKHLHQQTRHPTMQLKTRLTPPPTYQVALVRGSLQFLVDPYLRLVAVSFKHL